MLIRESNWYQNCQSVNDFFVTQCTTKVLFFEYNYIFWITLLFFFSTLERFVNLCESKHEEGKQCFEQAA